MRWTPCARRASSPMEQLTLDIGRRPHPTPAPTPNETRPATLAIPDATVSGLHARIQRASSGADLFIVQDLGSTNGTFVDGKRAHGPAPLRDGAVLFLGSQVAGVPHRHAGGAGGDATRTRPRRSGRSPTCSPSLAVTCAKLRPPRAVRRARSCSSARPASARRCSRTPSTPTAAARAASSPSTARRSRASWSRASCSATRRAPTRPRRAARSASSSWPTAARCSSTRSATCRRSCRRSCCASCRIGASRRWDRPASSRPTCASSPPPAASVCEKGAHVQEAVLGRLGAQPIVLPPLRDRVEDIGRLVAHFLRDLDRRPRVRARGVPRALPARLAAQRARAVEGDRQRPKL